MNGKPKMKMCWNCEGNVQISEPYCPYCRVLVGNPEVESPETAQQTFAPLYQTISPGEKKPLATPLYSLQEPIIQDVIPDDSDSEEQDSNSEDALQTVFTMLLLMGGAVVFLFSGILYFFSENGYLILKWKADYALIYLFLGVFLLFFGTHFLKKMHDD